MHPHELYQGLGDNDAERQTAYRELFRTELDQEAIADIRLAFNQNQPMGNERFHAKIKQMTGIRRQARTRGRPRVETEAGTVLDGQGELVL